MILMPMYNLVDYSDNYSKISGISWHYCRSEPAINVATMLCVLMQLMLLLIFFN